MITIKDVEQIKTMADEYTASQVANLSKNTEWIVFCSEVISQVKSIPLNNMKFEDSSLYDQLRQWQMQGSFLASTVDREVRKQQSKLEKAFNKQEGITNDREE